MPIATELPINTTATAMDMANEIFGSGVTVQSATYSGDALSSGIYTNGETVSPGVVPGDTGVILSTGHVSDFTNSSGTTNTNVSEATSTDTAGVDGDADFDSLTTAGTFDAAFLEVVFTPLGDQLSIDFVLSSEEYPEFISSVYNDVVGVWVNGTLATVSIGDGSASIGNINGGIAENLYKDNTTDQYNTEMDGFTVTLTFVAPVNPGVENTLKIGVADVADESYDTNLLLAGGAIQSTLVAQDDSISMATNKDKVVDVLANDSSTGGSLTITHINETPIAVGGSVTLATGQIITLNANGTLTVQSDADNETVYFTYGVQDTAGNTDTAIVKVVQTPCFVKGSLILTPDGPKPIESLKPGDLVITRDEGPLPIRWIGNSTIDGTGKQAPICIRKGTYGADRKLYVSPQHRILIRGYLAELLYGEEEILVKAKDLVNGETVFEAPCPQVSYYHMLFDTHQVVIANGVYSESYLPGDQTLPGFDPKVLAEITSLFPQLEDDANAYGPAARPILRGYEAAPLLSAMAA